MKNIKDITISIFAIIGFVAIVSGFTNNETESQQMSATPESHEWEMQLAERPGNDNRVYLYNKKTGEVRKYSSKGMFIGKLKGQYYQVMRENKQGVK